MCQHAINADSPLPQKNSKSKCFSLSRYLSLNSFLVNHLESGIIVSFISSTPLFFWSMYEASTTIRFRYSTESEPVESCQLGFRYSGKEGELTIIKQLHQTGRRANRNSRLALGEELLLLLDLEMFGKLETR